jgi:hypothetical protein
LLVAISEEGQNLNDAIAATATEICWFNVPPFLQAAEQAHLGLAYCL